MNTFTVRCLSVRQDGRHIHVKFAQPGAGHFNLTFPEFYKVDHDYVPGADYEIKLTKTLFSNSPAPEFPEKTGIDMSPVGLEDIPSGLEPDSDKVGGDNNPNPDTFTHVVTKETLDMNPDMAAQGVKVGDEIEVPLFEEQKYLPKEIEEKRQALLDALENHEADLMEKEAKSHEGNPGEAGLKELEDREKATEPPSELAQYPLKPEEALKADSDVPDINVGDLAKKKPAAKKKSPPKAKKS